MNGPAHTFLDARRFIKTAVVLLISTASIPAGAGIAVGPASTNSAAAERERVLRFQEAERSFQTQLQVGRERYTQKQADRAKIIEGMAWQLQRQQQTVVMQEPPPDEGHTEEREQATEVVLHWVAGLALAGALIGSGRRMHRLRVEDAWLRDRQLRFAPKPEPAPVEVSIEDETFFCCTPEANGAGRYTESGFVVLKGSTGPDENGPVSPRSREIRRTLLETGVIRAKDAAVVFESDHLFPSPTVAAVALTGKISNGWLEWKTKDGKTLETMERLRTRANFAPDLTSAGQNPQPATQEGLN